jgi:hypothetical protein
LIDEPQHGPQHLAKVYLQAERRIGKYMVEWVGVFPPREELLAEAEDSQWKIGTMLMEALGRERMYELEGGPRS